MGKRVTMRPARPGDLTEFYGEPSPMTCRAVVAERDGQPLGIGGVYYYRRQVIAFSQVKPELLDSKRDMVIASRATFKMIKALGVPVYALADDSLMNSAKTLEHYGFEKLADSPDGEMYIWRGDDSVRGDGAESGRAA